MARQSGRSNQNIFQGMIICHIVQNMLTSTRVLLQLDINAAGYLMTGLRGRDETLCIGDDKIKAREREDKESSLI
ncbi:hypothetical protein N7449_001998 [Penicillium cf. viridicatum]|uniref:Uncharacterized protein n=1 Tax=Penicillium cf. viridicatum TaxID=2972119 RepID=A0A9W9T313_9EURO|nr:hypothetical protein N7449_001998 [Penicillium cf. viridicatum]